MLKPLFKWEHGGVMRRPALMPPGYHKILQRRIPQPHQLKLERGIFRGLKRSDRKVNRLVVTASPIKNFWSIDHLISIQKQETRNLSSLSEMASVSLLLLVQVNVSEPSLTSMRFEEPILSLSLLEEGPNRAIPPLFSSKLVTTLKSPATIQGRKGSKEQTNVICDYIRYLPAKSLGA